MAGLSLYALAAPLKCVVSRLPTLHDVRIDECCQEFCPFHTRHSTIHCCTCFPGCPRDRALLLPIQGARGSESRSAERRWKSRCCVVRVFTACQDEDTTTEIRVLRSPCPRAVRTPVLPCHRRPTCARPEPACVNASSCCSRRASMPVLAAQSQRAMHHSFQKKKSATPHTV